MTADDFSRRQALALMFGTWSPGALLSEEAGSPFRMAISESVVGGVNLNDARVAMQIWVKRISAKLNVVIDPKFFSTTQEIVDRVRRDQLDAVALNVLEYRPIADLLDSTQILTGAGWAGQDQYLLLVKQTSGIKRLGDLQGRRLCILDSPKMCVAPAWLSTVVDEVHRGSVQQFFGSMTTDAKVSRAVLPVFFGQADACLTSKHGFDMMCELNPQVGRDLEVLASSPLVVMQFYAFRKNYPSQQREKLINMLSSLRNSSEGQELATLFQFDELTLRDGSSLKNALNILEVAEHIQARQGTRTPK